MLNFIAQEWTKLTNKGNFFCYPELGGCSIMRKPLCYHASDPGAILRGVHTTRSPYLLALLGQLSLPSLRGW